MGKAGGNTGFFFVYCLSDQRCEADPLHSRFRTQIGEPCRQKEFMLARARLEHRIDSTQFIVDKTGMAHHEMGIARRGEIG